MNKVIILSLSVIFLFGCNRPLKKPDNLISEQMFKKIMLDLYLSKHLTAITENNDIDYAQVNAAIFQKYGVSPKEYEESLKYYMINSDTYESMLEEIKDSLNATNKKEQKLEELTPPH